MKYVRPRVLAVASAALLPLAGTARAAEVPLAPVTSADGVECAGEADDVPVTVELTDGPDVLVPGTWADLTVRWTYAGDEPLATLYTYADLWVYPAEGEGMPWPFSIEWRAPDGWREVPFESDLAHGHFAVARDVQPGDQVAARLRVLVEDGPEGFADAGFGSMSVLADEACRWGEDVGVTFPVEGTVDEPQPTAQPSASGPELADTGAGPSLPLVGTAALALAAGAGAVLTARRRTRG